MNIYHIKERYKSGNLKVVWAVVDYESRIYLFNKRAKVTQEIFEAEYLFQEKGKYGNYMIAANGDTELREAMKKIRRIRRWQREQDIIDSMANARGQALQGLTEVTKNGDIVGYS